MAKKLFLKVITALIFIVAIAMMWVGFCTLNGEGLTADALKYNKKANELISSIASGNYEKASEYLAFSGEENKEQARAQWVKRMHSLDINVKKEEHSRLKADDGRVETWVYLYLEDNYYIQFTVGVQDGGFGIRNVWASYKDAALEDECIKTISSAMTSWNAG